MPFPVYSHTTLSDFAGSEDPISEGGVWSTYPGWTRNAAKISGQLGQGAGSGSYWATYRVSPTYSDFELILDIATIDPTDHYIEFQTRVGASPTNADWDGYKFEIYSGAGPDNNIYVVTNGSAGATLDLTVQTWASGDKIGIQCIGSMLGLWRHDGGSWANVCAGTDGTYTSGRFAIGAYGIVYRFDTLTVGVPDAAVVAWIRA